MTLNELRTEVSALGFEPGADTDPLLISAANRALTMICAEIPTVKTLRAPACPCVPSYYLCHLHHSAGERTELTLVGRAYSFSVSGRGRFTEISKAGRLVREFDTKISDFRGFIDESVSIVFDGEYDFDVLELSAFDSVIGDALSDIPISVENRICPDEIVDDFFAFTELPRDSEGNIIRGARLDGREVLLPKDFCGAASIRYEARPRMISRNCTAIDVSPSAVHLLPILTAYFVWLDDEPKLAESYLALYREMLASVKKKSCRPSCEYLDATGWA